MRARHDCGEPDGCPGNQLGDGQRTTSAQGKSGCRRTVRDRADSGGLNLDLGSQLDDAISRYLVIVRRVARVA